jgi:hypothetical protein
MLAGNEARALTWVNNVRERNALLTSDDFFRAFPIKSEALRSRVSATLKTLGF